MEACKCFFAHQKNKKMITEKHLVRHFLGSQRVLEHEELENVYWLPRLEDPADG